MANTTAIKGTRPAQLIRTDDSVPGVVSFYDRREADVEKALIGSVEVPRMGLRDDEPDLELNACVARAAVHTERCACAAAAAAAGPGVCGEVHRSQPG